MPITVLVVDDDVSILRVLTRLLAGGQYEVLLATSAEDVLVVDQAIVGFIDVVLVDLRLGDGAMTGEELARELRGRQPGLPVICMSGDADDVRDAVTRLGGPTWGLPKPFGTAELLAVIEAAAG